MRNVQIKFHINHLSLIEFPTTISRTGLFPVLGKLGGIFHFYSNLIEHSVSK